MRDNYALIDGSGIITDNFDTPFKAEEEFNKLCEEDFKFNGIVYIVKIFGALT